MITEIRPAGYIGLTSIHGTVGKLIRFGQWLNNDGFSVYEHAFTSLGNGQILEAEPGGARIVPITEYNPASIYWCDAIGSRMTHDQIMRAADPVFYNQFKGIKYSFLDYQSLVLHRFGVNLPGLRTYIQNSKHEICSQLADDFCQRLGYQVFDDGRWNGDVTPGALYKRDLELRRA